MWLLLKIGVVVPPLLLALVIIYLLNPVVTWLAQKGIRRGVAAVGTYVVMIGAVTGISMVVVPFVTDQLTGFGEQAPSFRAKLVKTVDSGAAFLHDRMGITVSTAPVDCLVGKGPQPGMASEQQCDRVTNRFREAVVGGFGDLLSLGVDVLGGVLLFVVAPILALYLLIDLPQLQRDALNAVPEAYRMEVADLAGKIGRTLGSYFRGQLVVALIVGILSAIGFRVIGLPFWLVIGAIAGFFNLVPLIGPFIGGAIGFVVGLVYGGIGLALQAALVEIVVQQLDNHFISPNVMRRAVRLHPVTVIVSLIAAGAAAGFWGMLLAVPVVATGKVLLFHLWVTRVLGVDVTPYGRRASSVPSPVPDVERRRRVKEEGEARRS